MAIGTPTIAMVLNATATAGTSFTTTDSLTCSANKLYLALVASSSSGGGGALPSGLTGGGQTWTQVATTMVTSNERLTLYRALSGSPGAGSPLTATWGSSQSNFGLITAIEYDGIKTSGTNGADAIVQAVTNSSSSASGLTVTLSSFADATNNVACGFFMVSSTSAATVGTGFTFLQNGTNQSRRWMHEYRTGEDTSVDVTGPSTRWAGIGLELAADTGLNLAPTGSEYTAQSGTPTYAGTFNAFRGLVLTWP